MTFSEALDHLRKGRRISRYGWNGRGMWLALVRAEDYSLHRADISHELLPWIGMCTVDSKFVPWLASQTDILAEDWGVV